MGDELKDEYGDFNLGVYDGQIDNATSKVKGKDPKGGSPKLVQNINK